MTSINKWKVLSISTLARLLFAGQALASEPGALNAKAELSVNCTLQVSQIWDGGSLVFNQSIKVPAGHNPGNPYSSDAGWEVADHKNIADSPNLNLFSLSLNYIQDGSKPYLNVGLHSVKFDASNNVKATVRYPLQASETSFDIYLEQQFGPQRFTPGIRCSSLDDYEIDVGFAAANPSLVLTGRCQLASSAKQL